MKQLDTKKSLANIAKLVFTVLVISACTKSRPPSFAEGDNDNLMSISDYDGKEFTLTTEKEIEKVSSSSSDKITKNDSSVQSYNIVKYTTDAKLMDNSPFIGKENSVYKIRYELTDSYLKVFKVAPKQLLSVTEMTYAEKQNDETFKIPLMGYPVEGYFQIKRSKNELNEETSRLMLKKENTKATASHFKINLQGKELFKAVTKINTFPADFFDGDWYYAETITAMNYAQGKSGYGAMISADQFGNEATKVRLKKSESALIFYNLNVDEKLTSNLNQRDENQGRVLSIPARWKQYKQADRGKDKGMNEEEDQNAAWSNRQFVELSLENSRSAIIDNAAAVEIRDIQIADDYFSYTTITTDNNMKIKHSLLRAKKSNYEPKTYFTSDRQKFGFFFTKKNVVNSADRYTEQDHETLNLINRYNPKNKTLEFRLSEQSPSWSEPIAREAVKQWNEAFRKAGLTTEVIFNEQRAQLGDIRYNIINLLDQPDGEFSWGGYGPSVNDPQTGERVASTSNVNLNDSLNFLIEIMRRMKAVQLGELKKDYILGGPLLSIESISDENNQQSLDLKNTGLLKNAVSVSSNNADNSVGLKLVDFRSGTNKKHYSFQNIKKATLNSSNINKLKYKAETGLNISYGNVIEDIQTHCEAVNKYINNLQSVSQTANSQDEYQMFLSCAKKVAPARIISVLLHEMGHNLGLRHNFYGSVDVRNFISKKARTSSVMEYTTSNEDRGGIGPYDIAAIRWAYNEQVEDVNSALIKVNGKQSLQDQVNVKNLKPYMYCTDEHVDVINTDPLCARSDAGTSYRKVVEQKIKDYYTSIALGNQRRGRHDVGTALGQANARLDYFLLPIKSIYDHWRIEVANFAGKGNEYLENYTIQEYQDLLARMEKDARYSQLTDDCINPSTKTDADGAACLTKYQDLQAASQMAYKFFKQIAFMPDQYCLVERASLTEAKTLQRRMISLSSIKQAIYDKHKEDINSCLDAKVLTYLSKEKGVTKVLEQNGLPFDDVFYNLSITENTKMNADYSASVKPDVLGTKYERANSLILLSQRARTSYLNSRMNFYPNFFDEPTYRQDLEASVMARLSAGLKIKSVFPKYTSEVYSLNFVNEKEILQFMFDQFKSALMIPGKPQSNSERLARFAVNYLYSNDLVQQYKSMGIDVATTQLQGQNYYAIEKSDISYHLLKNLDSLKQIREIKIPQSDIVANINSVLKQMLPNKQAIKKMTIGEYMQIVQSVIKSQGQLVKRQDAQAVLNYYNQVSGKLFYLSNLVNYYLKNLNIPEDQQTKFAEQFTQRTLESTLATLNKDVVDVLSKTEGGEGLERLSLTDLDSDSIDTLGAKALESIKSKYRVYEIDKEDYDAAIDLLTSTLL